MKGTRKAERPLAGIGDLEPHRERAVGEGDRVEDREGVRPDRARRLGVNQPERHLRTETEDTGVRSVCFRMGAAPGVLHHFHTGPGRLGRKRCVHRGGCTSAMSRASLDDIESIVHSLVRAKPCFPSGPRPANCGQHTGTPPRMAVPASKAEALDMKSRSVPSGVFHEVTCAP